MLYLTIPFWLLTILSTLANAVPGMCLNVFLKAEVLRWIKHAQNFKGQPCASQPSVVIPTWFRFSAKLEPTKTGRTFGVLLLCLMLAALVILKLPDCCAKHEQKSLGMGSLVSTCFNSCPKDHQRSVIVEICDMWYERIDFVVKIVKLISVLLCFSMFFFCMFSLEICWCSLHWGGSGRPWRSDAFVTLWCRTATSMGWRIWCYWSDKDFWWGTDGSDGTAKPWNQPATSTCRCNYWYRV